MKNINPEVSVVMPAFNSGQYIAEAIISILEQTFSDFEFIIINDGSVDNTLEVIKSFKDDRIVLLIHHKNKGNYPARNLGMEKARGKYICVMDSDDISYPERIKKQWDFMELNKEFAICGCYSQIIDTNEILTPPSDYDEIKVWLLSNIIFKHPSIFIRKSHLNRSGIIYDSTLKYASDYDFLVKIAGLFPVTNLKEVLLKHRKHPDQISTAHANEQGKIANKIRLKQLKNFNIEPSKEEKKIHSILMGHKSISNLTEFNILREWAKYLIIQNNNTNYYNSYYLSFFLKSLLKYILNEYKIKVSFNNLK